MRRVIPAIGLFFLAPFVAEFLLGDMPVTALVAVLMLAPMYGGGAVLIREVCRRRGWGWPGIALLAVGYGLVEEGLATQSLFNPHYAGKHLLSYGYLPALGIGASWTAFVLTLHTVWSIAVPIALAELLSRRRTEPWLGRVGLAVTALLYVLGVAVLAVLTHRQSGFLATPAQLAGTVVAAAVPVAVAVALGRTRRTGTRRAGRPPAPLLLGVLSLVVTSGVTGVWYLGKDHLPSRLFVALVLAGYAVVVPLLARLSARTGWGPAHLLGLAGGALGTYGWEAFVTRHLLVPATPAVALASHVLFALVAAALVLVAAVRLRGSGGTAPVPATT